MALVKSISTVESVSAFVYRKEHASILQSLGAEKVIVGDLRDRDLIRSAMQDVQCIYHICPNMSPDELIIGRMVIDEAQKADVEHIIYHSVLHPQTEKMNHHWQKLRMEEMLFESGIPFTILQPAPYMQNLLAGWKSIIEEGVLRIPYSIHAKFSFIDLEDLAEAAKIILTESNHRNAVYELAGTLPISHADAAEVFGHILSRIVRAEQEEISDWRRRAQGLSEYAVDNLIRMFEYYNQWGLAGNPNVLRWILKREPTQLGSFAKRTKTESF